VFSSTTLKNSLLSYSDCAVRQLGSEFDDLPVFADSQAHEAGQNDKK
jgi:hypothetical protein